MKKSLLVCSAAFVLNHAAFADTDLTDQTLTQPTGTVETTENKSEEHSVQRSVVMEKVQMLEESSEQFFAYISECASFLPENYPRLQELNKELNKDAELRERVEKKLANGEEPEGEGLAGRVGEAVRGRVLRCWPSFCKVNPRIRRPDGSRLSPGRSGPMTSASGRNFQATETRR